MFGDGFILNLPRFFTLFGFNIYYYGLFVTAGYALAGVYLLKRRRLFGLTSDNILDLIFIAIICGLVGARIYYMIFNFGNFFAPGKWGNILRFRDGGLAVYGGIIASGLGFLIYSRVKKIPVGKTLDAAGFGLFVGQAVGRWGNFVNREAYGVETDLPWKMGLTSRGVTTYVHPAFIYEGLWNVAGLIIMHIFSKKSKTKYPGQYFLFYVAWYGLGRCMIEGLRTDSLRIPGTELRASQWLACISFLIAIGILFYNHFRGKGTESDYDEDTDDDVDPEDTESADELAELDGATDDDVNNESEDEVDESNDSDEEKPDDGEDSEAVDEEDDSDEDDDSEDETVIDTEDESDNNNNENNEEE